LLIALFSWTSSKGYLNDDTYFLNSFI